MSARLARGPCPAAAAVTESHGFGPEPPFDPAPVPPTERFGPEIVTDGRGPSRRGLRCAAIVSAVAALLVAGCLPAAATAEGREVTRLYGFFLAAAAVVAAIVVGLTTWAIVRYRRRADDDALPPQTRGSLRLEIVWTVLPAITIVVLFGLTMLALVRLQSTEDEPGAEIAVTAFRWGWSFEYPGEGVTVSGFGQPGPEIVVPVGEPLRFSITSADVIHAFYVPAFLLKSDANPGRQNVFQVTVEEPGTYGGQCAEFCGIYHARMPFTIRAVERADYDAWLDDRRAAAEAAADGP